MVAMNEKEENKITVRSTPIDFVLQQRQKMQQTLEAHPPKNSIVIAPAVGNLPLAFEDCVLKTTEIFPVLVEACNHIEILFNVVNSAMRALELNNQVLDEEQRFLKKNKLGINKSMADIYCLNLKIIREAKLVLTHGGQ